MDWSLLQFLFYVCLFVEEVVTMVSVIPLVSTVVSNRRTYPRYDMAGYEKLRSVQNDREKKQQEDNKQLHRNERHATKQKQINATTNNSTAPIPIITTIHQSWIPHQFQ